MSHSLGVNPSPRGQDDLLARSRAIVRQVNADLARAIGQYDDGTAGDDPTCPWESVGECSTARERSVAGFTNDVPACPVHGPYVDAPDDDAPGRDTKGAAY